MGRSRGFRMPIRVRPGLAAAAVFSLAVAVLMVCAPWSASMEENSTPRTMLKTGPAWVDISKVGSLHKFDETLQDEKAASRKTLPVSELHQSRVHAGGNIGIKIKAVPTKVLAKLGAKESSAEEKATAKKPGTEETEANTEEAAATNEEKEIAKLNKKKIKHEKYKKKRDEEKKEQEMQKEKKEDAAVATKEEKENAKQEAKENQLEKKKKEEREKQ